MKKLKWLLVILGLLLALGIGFHRQLRNLWVNLTFPLTEHTETEWKVKEYADLHGVSYADYPASLVALLERNPETEDFVLNYPFRQAWSGDMSGFSRDRG